VDLARESIGQFFPFFGQKKHEMRPFSGLKFLLENSQTLYKCKKIRVFGGLETSGHMLFLLLNFCF